MYRIFTVSALPLDLMLQKSNNTGMYQRSMPSTTVTCFIIALRLLELQKAYRIQANGINYVLQKVVYFTNAKIILSDNNSY